VVPGQVGRPACFDGAAESDLAPQLEAYCRRWCGSFHGTMMAARAADMRSAVEHAAQRSAANVLPSRSRSRIAYEARLRLPRARPREPAAVALTIDDCDRSESFAAIDEVQAGGLTRGPLANTTERRASGDLQVRSALAPRHPLPSRGGNPPCGDRRLRDRSAGEACVDGPGTVASSDRQRREGGAIDRRRAWPCPLRCRRLCRCAAEFRLSRRGRSGSPGGSSWLGLLLGS